MATLPAVSINLPIPNRRGVLHLASELSHAAKQWLFFYCNAEAFTGFREFRGGFLGQAALKNF